MIQQFGFAFVYSNIIRAISYVLLPCLVVEREGGVPLQSMLQANKKKNSCGGGEETKKKKKKCEDGERRESEKEEEEEDE